MSYTTDPRQDSVLDFFSTFRFARLLKITRTDGTVIYLTDHNKDITFSGNTYKAVGGFQASATEHRAAQSENNFSAKGVINSLYISDDDLRLGLYDEAQIDEYIVDWKYPRVIGGELRHDTWWITDLKYNDEQWEAQLEGPSRWFSRKMGDAASSLCRHQLGEGICGQGVNLESLGTYKFSIAVATVVTDKLSFTVSSLAAADALMNNGRVVWTSGPLTGLISEIKTWTLSTKTFVLEIPTAVSFEVGDGATVYAGCDKTEATCKATFSNFDNFGGRPTIAGTDQALPIRV